MSISDVFTYKTFYTCTRCKIFFDRRSMKAKKFFFCIISLVSTVLGTAGRTDSNGLLIDGDLCRSLTHNVYWLHCPVLLCCPRRGVCIPVLGSTNNDHQTYLISECQNAVSLSQKTYYLKFFSCILKSNQIRSNLFVTQCTWEIQRSVTSHMRRLRKILTYLLTYLQPQSEKQTWQH